MRIIWRCRSFASPQPRSWSGEPFRRTVQGLAAAHTRYGVLIGRLSEALPILLKMNNHRIRGDVARPNPAAAPRSAAFSRAIRPGVRGQSPRGA
jgi:hypothetical protein